MKESGEEAEEEEGRKGWDKTWVQGEELKGRMREIKPKLFFCMCVWLLLCLFTSCA